MIRRLECDPTAFLQMKDAVLYAEMHGFDQSIAALESVDIDWRSISLGSEVKVVVCLHNTPVFPMGQAYLIPAAAAEERIPNGTGEK